MPKFVNGQGQAVYFNTVEKGGKIKYVVLAASGQALLGRDKQRLKSRTFTQEHQAQAFIQRLGYTKCAY